MKNIKNMEFQAKGVVEMLKKQNLSPYMQCVSVDEVLREFPGQTTRAVAVMIFMLGFIEGKRAERTRRKCKKHE